MTTEQKIARIIEDVCAADPSLHEREQELRPVVRAILEAQPDTKFDEAFAARVRAQVLAEASKGRPAKPSFLDRLRGVDRSAFFVLGTAALGLVLAVSLATVSALGIRIGGKPAGIAQVAPSDSFKPLEHKTSGVVALADGAFGRLQGIPASPPPEAVGLGGGGGGVGRPAPMAAEGVDKTMMPIAPEAVALRYVYKGDITPPAGKVTVYRRVKGFGSSASTVLSATRGIVDLSKLGDAKLQSFNVIDDREFGYNVFVDAADGAVTFSQYWPKWPHPEAQCQDDECFKRVQLRPEQMPPDDRIIGIADAFLDQFGIAKDGYGAPVARNDFQRSLALAGGDASKVYVPESVPVVYPIVIDGLRVHEQSGEVTGMLVGVNIRQMKVDNAWGITSNSYESSSYEGETDAAKLRAYLEHGGTLYESPAAKTVDVPVGDPENVLVRVWRSHDDGTADELYMPALRFPVLEAPKDQPWTPSAVIVPLAKEAIEQAPPVVMPFDQPMTR